MFFSFVFVCLFSSIFFIITIIIIIIIIITRNGDQSEKKKVKNKLKSGTETKGNVRKWREKERKRVGNNLKEKEKEKKRGNKRRSRWRNQLICSRTDVNAESGDGRMAAAAAAAAAAAVRTCPLLSSAWSIMDGCMPASSMLPRAVPLDPASSFGAKSNRKMNQSEDFYKPQTKPIHQTIVDFLTLLEPQTAYSSRNESALVAISQRYSFDRLMINN